MSTITVWLWQTVVAALLKPSKKDKLRLRICMPKLPGRSNTMFASVMLSYLVAIDWPWLVINRLKPGPGWLQGRFLILWQLHTVDWFVKKVFGTWCTWATIPFISKSDSSAVESSPRNLSMEVLNPSGNDFPLRYHVEWIFFLPRNTHLAFKHVLFFFLLFHVDPPCHLRDQQCVHYVKWYVTFQSTYSITWMKRNTKCKNINWLLPKKTI